MNRITHDYTLTAARAFASISSPSQTSFRFIFMSGEGADQTEQSRYLFGRIKGRTEKALAAMETETFKTISVRPGGIVPTESVSSLVCGELSMFESGYHPVYESR